MSNSVIIIGNEYEVVIVVMMVDSKVNIVVW
jgi:hypothetical protein